MLAAKAAHSEGAAVDAEEAARVAVLALLAACERNRSWARIGDAADAAYLAVGRLAALARAADSN